MLKSRDNYYRGYANPQKKCKMILIALAIGMAISGTVLLFFVGLRGGKEYLVNNLIICWGVFAVTFGIAIITMMCISSKQVNKALARFSKQLVKDTEEMRKNKNHLSQLDMTLRLLIFIEVVNTVKVLIMQNIEFLRR